MPGSDTQTEIVDVVCALRMRMRIRNSHGKVILKRLCVQTTVIEDKGINYVSRGFEGGMSVCMVADWVSSSFKTCVISTYAHVNAVNRKAPKRHKAHGS